MLMARVLLVLAAVALVVLGLAYSFGNQDKVLPWLFWLIRVTVGFMILFGLFYILERLILI